MKTIILVLAILAIVIAGGYYLMHNNVTVSQSPTPTASVSSEPLPSEFPIASETVSPSPTATTATVKEFTVTGVSYKFMPSEIRVKKGDKVRVTFKNNGGTHDWVLDEFNVKTKLIGSGQTDTVEFVADKAGTFEYYCSVGTHRQLGMKGNLIVE